MILNFVLFLIQLELFSNVSNICKYPKLLAEINFLADFNCELSDIVGTLIFSSYLPLVSFIPPF